MWKTNNLCKKSLQKHSSDLQKLKIIVKTTFTFISLKHCSPISKLSPPFNIFLVNDQILGKPDNPEVVMFSWKLRTNQNSNEESRHNPNQYHQNFWIAKVWWPVVDTFPIRARSLSSPIRYFPLILDSLCVSQVSQVELDKSNIGKTTLSALIEILKATFSYTATCWKLLALRPKRDGVLKQSSTSFWHCPYFHKSNMLIWVLSWSNLTTNANICEYN